MIIKTSYSTATEPKSDLQITIKNYFFGCFLGSLSSCETFCQCFSWERYPCQISCKTFRSSHPEVLLEKGVLKICSKFTWEHPCRSVISINHISTWVFSCKFAAYFQTPFTKNTSWWLLANVLELTSDNN